MRLLDAVEVGSASSAGGSIESWESLVGVVGKVVTFLLPRLMEDPIVVEVAGLDQRSESEDGAFTRMAQGVGGDLSIVIPVGSSDKPGVAGESVLLCVADSAGHGAWGAALTTRLDTAIRVLAQPELSLSYMAERIDNLIGATARDNQFATAIFLLLDPQLGRCRYLNAEHPPGLILCKEESVVQLSSSMRLLGFGRFFEPDRSDILEGICEIHPGEIMALFTDGILEVSNEHEEQFGLERLIGYLQEHFDEPAAAIANSISEELERFQGDSGFWDDVTLLILKREVVV